MESLTVGIVGLLGFMFCVVELFEVAGEGSDCDLVVDGVYVHGADEEEG